MAGVLREHRLDERVAAFGVPGLAQGRRERDLGVAPLVGGLGLGDDCPERGDALLGAALGHVEPGERAGVGDRVGGGRCQRLELGPRRLRPAGRAERLHQREVGRDPLRAAGRLRRGPGAQQRLGGVDVAALEVPLDPGARHRVVLREEPGHPRQLAADRRPVAPGLEHRELREVQRLVLGRQAEPGLDQPERGPRVARLHPVGDQHHPGGQVRGRLVEHAARHRDRGLALAGLVVDGRLEGADLGVLRVELPGALGVGPGGLEVLDAERQLGQPLVAGDVAPVLLDQPQELADGLLDPAFFDHQVGVVEPGRLVLAVELEDVAELDDRLLDLALGDERLRPLVVAGGALLGGVAGRKPERREKHERGQEAQAGHAGHSGLKAARGPGPGGRPDRARPYQARSGKEAKNV